MRETHSVRVCRSRRALAWAAGTFLLCQFVAGLLLDYVWPGVRFRGLDHGLAACRTAADSSQPIVLALGSSRFGCGLQASVLESELGQGAVKPRVINFSMPGGDFITAEHLYARCREAGCKPALVLLEVSPETLARRNLWLDIHVLRQLTWPDGPRFAADLIRSGHAVRYLASRLVPLYVHRDHLRHLALKQLGLADQAESKHRTELDAFFAAAVVQSEQALTADQMRQRSLAGAAYIQRWLRNYQIGGNAKRSFDRLLQRCAEDGTSVVLVAVPVSSPHRQLYTPNIESPFQETMRQTLNRYPQFRFLDLRTALADQEFYDNHHTTSAGALHFSRRLAQELRAVTVAEILPKP